MGVACRIIWLRMSTIFLVDCLSYLLVSVLFLLGDEVGELYIDIYMYLRMMGLAGSFGNGVLICIVVCFMFRRLVSIL